MNINDLINEAKKARQNSYSPHSNYMVGACLKTKSGKLYTGCNIENDGIMSICAERVAFCKAISEGEHEFDAIAIVGGPKDTNNLDICYPCGYCRQFMSEFVDRDFKIYIVDTNDNTVNCYSINDLLPHSFKFN